MAGRKVAKGKEKKSDSNAKVFHITCTDECGATADLVFSGDGPYKEATLKGAGWAVLNSPEDGSIAFLCASCFKKLEPDDPVDEEDLSDKDFDS